VTRSTLTLVAASTAVLLACGPAWAQDAPPQENPAKLQAFRFEAMLRNAIEMAGQRLAQQARRVAPDLTLQVSEPAIARGVKLTGYGFHFDVQAPDITSTMIVWDMMRGPRPQSTRPVTPISGGSEGPIGPGPTGPPTAVFDPDQAYTTYVKEAVIDSLLDDSSMLALGPNEFLSVAVSGIEQPTNVLYRRSADKLVLTIKGSDLTDLRQGRITREQAKERLTQERF
jgi:hypothetical protein